MRTAACVNTRGSSGFPSCLYSRRVLSCLVRQPSSACVLNTNVLQMQPGLRSCKKVGDCCSQPISGHPEGAITFLRDKFVFQEAPVLKGLNARHCTTIHDVINSMSTGSPVPTRLTRSRPSCRTAGPCRAAPATSWGRTSPGRSTCTTKRRTRVSFRVWVVCK